MEKSAASLKKSQESQKSKATSKETSKAGDRPHQRSAIDMGVISDEAISQDSDSVNEKKKKETGEVTAEGDGEGQVEFDQKEPEVNNEMKQKDPMQQLGKQPFGIAAERQAKEELF